MIPAFPKGMCLQLGQQDLNIKTDFSLLHHWRSSTNLAHEMILNSGGLRWLLRRSNKQRAITKSYDLGQNFSINFKLMIRRKLTACLLLSLPPDNVCSAIFSKDREGRRDCVLNIGSGVSHRGVMIWLPRCHIHLQCP